MCTARTRPIRQASVSLKTVARTHADQIQYGSGFRRKRNAGHGVSSREPGKVREERFGIDAVSLLKHSTDPRLFLRGNSNRNSGRDQRPAWTGRVKQLSERSRRPIAVLLYSET